MARFYGDIKSDKGLVTKTGTAASGIMGHIRGWNIGMRVECSAEDIGTGKKKKEVDVCRVWKTEGSNNAAKGKLLAEVKSK